MQSAKADCHRHRKNDEARRGGNLCGLQDTISSGDTSGDKLTNFGELAQGVGVYSPKDIIAAYVSGFLAGRQETHQDIMRSFDAIPVPCVCKGWQRDLEVSP